MPTSINSDILAIDSLFTPEEQLTRDTVRRFVENDVTPLMKDAFEHALFPTPLIPQLAQMGLLGITLPEAFGGSNANAVTYGLICQELERGDSGLRSFVSVQNSLCMYPIFQYGTDTHRQQFLPDMVAGESIACFGLTEADSGSDPNSMKTTAKKTKGGWILNGSKMWITNAPIADLAIVWAKTENGIRGFIVERSFAGFATQEITHKLSLRASATGEIILTDCFVPESHYLPGTEKGLSAALGCLTQARYGIAWGVIGAAMACYETALDYAKTRIQFDKPIAAFQLVQKDLVDMFAAITQAQLLNLHIGRLKEKNQSDFAMISLAKMNSCKVALDVARKARNILGANGISLDYPVIRHMVNLESVFTYEGTDNIHHLIVGKHLTGLDAFQ
jgi:glutaryl-CoA dehydrogenase